MPPPPLMGNSCVPVEPTRSVNSFAIQRFHPVPIDLCEMRKLCEVEQSCSVADFEGVCETRCVPVFVGRTADPDPSSTAALRVSPTAGVIENRLPSRSNEGLSYPLFEIIGPSVVIRRRPHRVQSLGVTAPTFTDLESDPVTHL